MSLVACLKNTRAKNWYMSISNARLRTSTQDGKELLKRDFGIKPFRAKQLAQRETFSFSQGRPVLQYFHKKVACLFAEVRVEEVKRLIVYKVFPDRSNVTRRIYGGSNERGLAAGIETKAYVR